jgi:HEAT repeat protein
MSGSREERASLWANVRELEQARDVNALVELIRDPPSGHAISVRAAAAQALGNLEAEEAVPALIELLNDEDEEVRAGAAHALGRIGGREALARVAALVNDHHWRVRGVALWELRLRDDERAAPAARMLINDPGREVRTAAVLTLAALGTQDDVARLESGMRTDRFTRRRFYRKAIKVIRERAAAR